MGNMTADGAPSGTPPERVHRPDPVRWVWYAFGGSLPSRYDTWVYRDTTSRTWVLRHIARSLVQLAIPIAAVIVLLPGPLWVRLMTALGGVLLGLIFSSAYMTETIEHRLVRAGYPAGTAAEAHQRAAGERETAAGLRRRKAAARRAARYQARMRG
jgi:Family of unknown function (DUF5313)